MTKRVLILARQGGPYSYLALQALVQHNVPLFGVALGENRASAKSLQIWNERTAGKLVVGDIREFESDSCPFYMFKSHADEGFEDFVRQHDVDLLVNAGTPHILRENILSAPRIGVLNVHPGLLPDYRGCTTLEWSIFNDDPVGHTAHFMTTGIDEGPIIAQERYSFKKTDDYTDIRVKMYQANVAFMARVIRKITDEDITPHSLPTQGEGTYWDVMDDATLQSVKDKVANGRYKYQI